MKVGLFIIGLTTYEIFLTLNKFIDNWEHSFHAAKNPATLIHPSTDIKCNTVRWSYILDFFKFQRPFDIYVNTTVHKWPALNEQSQDVSQGRMFHHSQYATHASIPSQQVLQYTPKYYTTISLYSVYPLCRQWYYTLYQLRRFQNVVYLHTSKFLLPLSSISLRLPKASLACVSLEDLLPRRSSPLKDRKSPLRSQFPFRILSDSFNNTVSSSFTLPSLWYNHRVYAVHDIHYYSVSRT